MLAAEQCGGIPASFGQRVCKRRTTANETTSKTRTAAASWALGAKYYKRHLEQKNLRNIYMLLFMVALMSSANSQNWTLINSGTISNLNSVSFIGADTGYVVGDNNTILKTVNSGLFWTPLGNEPDTISLRCIYFKNANTGWVVGQYSTILRTSDGGATWLTGGLIAYGGDFNSIYFPTADTGYLVGGEEVFSEWGWQDKSINAGHSWHDSQSFGVKRLNSVYFTDEYNGYTVGNGGTIMKTENGAINWDYLPSGTTENLNCVIFHDLNNGLIVGDGGLILKTTNGGYGWTTIPSGTSERLLSVCFYDVNNGYAAGDNGTILNTTDGGNSWISLWSGTKQHLHSICFPESQLGYAVGDSGTIVKTTNGGGVWINQSNSISKKINIFPNPITDYFTVELPSIPQNATIFISNVKNEILYKYNVCTNKIKIDVSNLSSSVYILRYLDNNIEYHIKLVKK